MSPGPCPGCSWSVGARTGPAPPGECAPTPLSPAPGWGCCLVPSRSRSAWMDGASLGTSLKVTHAERSHSLSEVPEGHFWLGWLQLLLQLRGALGQLLPNPFHLCNTIYTHHAYLALQLPHGQGRRKRRQQ